MNILYHRISGSVGLTAQESGTRGAWVEKRLTTLRWLQARGHDVCVATRLTKATRAAAPGWIAIMEQPEDSAEYLAHADLLVLEFGPSNGSWYAEDYAFTQQLVQAYQGRDIVYLCDDPDLLKPSVCRYVPQADWSRWTFLLNCQHPERAAEVLRAPAEARYGEFNPGIGMPVDVYQPAELELLCYPGRPGGRKAQVAAMLDSDVVQIISSPGDWKAYKPTHGVMPSPEQSARRDFYRRYAGLVCAFDDTHSRLGWRTGRAYHALAAGVPVLAFPGNPALWWALPAGDAGDIATSWALLTDGDDYRRSAVSSQRTLVSQDETDLLSQPAAQALGL